MRWAIDAQSVEKKFESGGVETRVLKSVSFCAVQGEFVMLVGPSGSGKTTLLSILGCVLRPSAGSLALLGRDVGACSDADLPRLRSSLIGFVFQGHNLIAALSAEENIALQMQLRGFSRADSVREARLLLDRVGLGHRRDHKPDQLSGGQRQRVAVARAMAGRPPIILADEPTASLDVENGLIVTRMMKELASERGHTVVVVTHDNRIFDYADRIERIEDGLIVRAHPTETPALRRSA
jgi:putative ABC transport system ATP-binding protein